MRVNERPTQPPAAAVPDRLAHSYEETGFLLDLSERSVFQLVRDGKLHAVTIGRRSRRILRSEIEKYLAMLGD